MSTPDPLHAADMRSRIGLYVGLSMGGILAAVDITWWLAHRQGPLAGWLHTLIVAGLLTLVICSWGARVGLSIVRSQRRLMEQVHIVRLQVLTLASWRLPATGRATLVNGVREFDTAAEPVSGQVAANGNGKLAEVEGLSPEMVEIARRTSARLRGPK